MKRLPKIPLPKFSGDAKDWIAFRDLFTDMVIKSKNSHAAKLSYLKSSLTDEPLYLIKNVNVTNGQFQSQVWQKLLDQYYNNRKIIYAHVNSLINLKTINAETADPLRNLINEITDSVESLKTLQVLVDQWNCILVPLIVRCLERTPHRDWE